VLPYSQQFVHHTVTIKPSFVAHLCDFGRIDLLEVLGELLVLFGSELRNAVPTTHTKRR
jgi:hypothetical protein